MAKQIDNQNANVKKQPSGGHPGDASTRTFKHVEHTPPGYKQGGNDVNRKVEGPATKGPATKGPATKK